MERVSGVLGAATSGTGGLDGFRTAPGARPHAILTEAGLVRRSVGGHGRPGTKGPHVAEPLNAPASDGGEGSSVETELLAGLLVNEERPEQPVLLDSEGKPLDTWRENYPYESKLRRRSYERQKR